MTSPIHQPYLEAITRTLKSPTRRVGNTARGQIIKAIFNSSPQQYHPNLMGIATDFWEANTRSSRNQGRAETEYAARCQWNNIWDIQTFFRLVKDHGGHISNEDRQTILSMTSKQPIPAESARKLTAEEKYHKWVDDGYDADDRATRFMVQRSPGESKDRFNELRSRQECGAIPDQYAYINKKSLKEFGKAFISDGQLIVPTTNASVMHRDNCFYYSGWQSIKESGEKKFMSGQVVKNQFTEFGTVYDANIVLVCEGWATGATLHEATGLPVAAALSLNNMGIVAANLLHCETEGRVKKIVLAADTGHDEIIKEFGQILWSEHSAVTWVVPPVDNDNVDWNDFAATHGIDAVKNCIKAVIDRDFNAIRRQNPFEDAPAAKPGFFRPLGELMTNDHRVEWVIKGQIPKQSFCSITGPTGVYKSFYADNAALCVASGITFFGRKVQQTGVLIIQAEGGSGTKPRFKGLQHELGLSESPENLYITSGPIDLLDTADLGMVKNFITENEIGLVIIDTFARCFIGDENSAKDVGTAIQNITKNFIGAGAAVLLVHHTGHGDQSRARGSSVFRAALDVEIGFEKTEGGIRVKCWKVKDCEPWPDEGFKPKVVDTGFQDEDGLSVTTLVLELAAVGKRVTLSPKDSRLWAALQGIKVPFTAELAKETLFPLIDSRNKGQAVFRLLNKLLEQNLIRYESGIYSFKTA